MVFSFEYYDWLRNLSSLGPVLIFVSIFGSLIFITLFTLLQKLLRSIGLKAIADWKPLNDMMTCIALTGFIGGFVLLIFTAILSFGSPSNDNITGIRYIMIWLALFVCISSFYFINRTALRKWFNETSDSTKSTGKKGNKKKAKKAIK